MVAWPVVGSVMRERIFNSVDLPAPLRPMMPMTSPSLTAKETSRRAQNSSPSAGPGPGAVSRDHRPRTPWVSESRRVSCRFWCDR